MQNYQFIQWAAALTGLAFWFAFGAICGSFINVLVYRLPKGLDVVSPPSACPACGTRLTWRENVPILGWLLLRGRCRFCRSPISPEYPIVELFVAALFGAMWSVWFMEPSLGALVGVRPATWRPDFAVEGIGRMWPMWIIVLSLVGSLVASTLIDARTFTIPLVLPWFAATIGLLGHPLHALWIQSTGGTTFMPFTWTIPFRSGGGVGLALGGGLGIALSIVLLRWKILPQSFADYAAWEQAVTSTSEQAAISEVNAPAETPTFGTLFSRTLLLTGPAVALMLLGFTLGLSLGNPLGWTALGAGVGLIMGIMLRRIVMDRSGLSAEEPIWTRYPYGRREMVKEIAFVLPACLLGALGYWLCRPAGLLGTPTSDAPLWVLALAGSLLGFLAGGGIVWLFRIGGTLALGKEAMGLGDVHLMAAVGACLGWMDPLLAFFTAPFLGIGWALLSVAFRQVFHRKGTALPYGPHLAAATLMVLLLKPLYELALSAIMGRPINIP